MKKLIVIFSALFFSNAYAIDYGSWKIVKSNGLATLVSSPGMTIAAPGVANNSNGINVFGVPSASMPAGKTAMTIQFDFKSNGFFSAERAAHIPIALLSEWQNTNPTPPVSGTGGGFIVGRGIIIGSVGARADGCSAGNIAEVESFRRDTNALYLSTCTAGSRGANTSNLVLNDYVTYKFTISASHSNFTNGSNVMYYITNSAGITMFSAGVMDTLGNLPTNLGGWMIGHVFSNNNPNVNWSLEFNNISVTYQ